MSIHMLAMQQLAEDNEPCEMMIIFEPDRMILRVNHRLSKRRRDKALLYEQVHDAKGDLTREAFKELIRSVMGDVK